MIKLKAANSCVGGSIRLWALIVSILVHTAALGVFAGIRMSGGYRQEPAQRPALNLQAIERMAERPRPVPRVEPVAVPAAQEIEQTPLVEPITEPPVPVLPERVDVLPGPAETAVVEMAAAETAAPEVEFFGQKSYVQQICYVVDCSGSMYGQMYRVKDELKKSISKLNSSQAFCVLFFMDGQKILMSGKGLETATAATKSQAFKLIAGIRPGGTTDAAHAIEVALRLEGQDGRAPEVIYFLTDGFDLEAAVSQDFVETVENLRQSLAPQAVIHTTGFSPQRQDRTMLETLARNTGGGFVEIN